MDASTLWRKYLYEKKWWYLLGFLGLLLTDGAQLVQIELFGTIIDYFNSSENLVVSVILTYCLFYGLLQLAVSSGRSIWRLCIASQSQRARGFLRTIIFDRMLYYPLKAFTFPYSKGNLMNISTSDNTMAISIFGFTLVGFFDCIILSTITLSMMFYINGVMTMLVILMISPLPFFVERFTTREGRLHDQAQIKMTELNDVASQSVETVRLQRITSSGSFWQLLLYHFADIYRQSRYRAMRYTILIDVMFVLVEIVACIVLFTMGISLVINGKFTVGEFVIFQGLITKLRLPLMQVGFVISEMKNGHISLKRIVAAANYEIESFLKKDGIAFNHHDVAYQVDNLNFSYGDKQVLKNFNLTLKTRERLGIMGEIGSGKSTLVDILSGMTNDYSGSVKLMGHDIFSYDHAELRKNVGVVSQKTFLFATTIRENICLGENFSDSEIIEALRVAGISNDILTLKNGIDTEIGEWGINLSGGQKQRLSIARTIIRKPKVLIMDDCLSAVDMATEEFILNNLNDFLKDTTIIWIAHRESTLKYVDRIIRV